jgi:Mg2+/Co2+ transporter CorB
LDETPIGWLFGLLALFIGMSAFFSGSETGIMTANRYKLKHAAKTGNRSAQRVLDLLAKTDRLLGILLIGNTLANFAASSVATLIWLRLFGDEGVAIGVGLITFIALIFGEAGPKTFAAFHPERVAYLSAWVLTPLLRIAHPLVWLVNSTTRLLFRINQLAAGEKGDKLNSEELHTLVGEVFLPKHRRNMLLSVLELENITVNDIMIPRHEVVGINIDDDLDRIVAQLRTTHHTRLPVYKGELHNTVGILHIRNATRFMGKPELSKAEILQYAREPYFVPEGTPLTTQLVNFQKMKRRIGLVVDEYGDVQGVVTLEDILEEIVGEFTTNVSETHKDITPQPDGTQLIDGSATIRDINRALHWHLPSSGPRTLNGLILEYLETIPESALSLKIGEYLVEVVQIKDNTVKTARVCLLAHVRG